MGAIFAAIVLIAIQFFQPNQVNPAVVPEEALEVPENVAAVMKLSCNDCHTNTTVYPWYSKISPVSWFLDDHIQDGRKELNFSVWNTYTVKKKIHKLEEVCEQLESKAMPLPSYLWLHRDAALTEEDGKILCEWAKGEKARLEQQQ